MQLLLYIIFFIPRILPHYYIPFILDDLLILPYEREFVVLGLLANKHAHGLQREKNVIKCLTRLLLLHAQLSYNS